MLGARNQRFRSRGSELHDSMGAANNRPEPGCLIVTVGLSVTAERSDLGSHRRGLRPPFHAVYRSWLEGSGQQD
jgi:hypothetical protein